MVGAVAFAGGEVAMVGLVALGVLVAVLGAILLRDAIRAARRPGGRQCPPSPPAGHRRGRLLPRTHRRRR
ncbi:hypothetical protein NKG94_46175 [Micromonospora sp. M12]